MDFSKDQKLKFKIEELQKETGLSEQEVKKLFIETYLLGEEKKSANELFSEWMRKQIK